MSHSFNVRFWGVRGSLPTPGPETAGVGGNTACIEVVAGGTRVILDAGTGLRALGDSLFAKGEIDHTTILLSHVHWDHVMGFPFFGPLYSKKSRIDLATGAAGVPLADLMKRQMSAPMFPVDFERVPSKVACRDLEDGERFTVGDVQVEIAKLNHPDPVYAFRLEHGGRSIVYATDTEHFSCVDPRLLRLCDGADLVIYDAQYTPEEYAGEVGPPRTGWGHSTYAAGVDLAKAARVKSLALFHHDPRRSDAAVEAIGDRARQLFDGVVVAREGLVVAVGA